MSTGGRLASALALACHVAAISVHENATFEVNTTSDVEYGQTLVNCTDPHDATTCVAAPLLLDVYAPVRDAKETALMPALICVHGGGYVGGFGGGFGDGGGFGW